jgi:hypothetical protein
VSQHVIPNRKGGAPEVFVVWGAILPDDGAQATAAAARALDAPGVRQYWDPGMALGRALGDALGVEPQPFAWDVYLFFEWDRTFAEGVPTPMAWAHQMVGAVPQRRHTPERLDHFLREYTTSLDRMSAGGERDANAGAGADADR